MAGSKIAQLRQGTPPHKIINIRGVSMAVVLLPSDTVRKIEEKVEQYCNINKDKVNENVRNQYYDSMLAYESLRDDNNLDEHIADNMDEITKVLSPTEINYVCTIYGELMMDKDPRKLELLTAEQFEELKKYLEETPLSDLNTVSLVHLSNFRQAMISGN